MCLNIFSPSNGGNGIKLNTPIPIFIIAVRYDSVIKILIANSFAGAYLYKA